MNIKRFLWMVWTALVLLAISQSACKDDKDDPAVTPPEPVPELIIPDAAWTFSGYAGLYELNIVSEIEWTASADAEWITLSETTGNGDIVVGVEVTENTGAKRTGTISIKNLADSKVIMSFKVIQEAVAESVIVTSEDTVRNIPAAGKAIVLEVEANVDYSFILSEWVNVAAAPSALGMKIPFALTKSQITLNVSPNESEEARTSSVVVRKGSSLVKEVVLMQLGKVYEDELVVDVEGLTKDTLHVDPAGGTVKVVLGSNMDYTVLMSPWGESSLMKVGEKITSTMNFTMEPNLTFGKRSRSLMIQGVGEEAEPKRIILAQAPVEIQVQSYLPAPAKGGMGQIKVTCPEKFAYRVVDNLPGAVMDPEHDDPEHGLLAFNVEEMNKGVDRKLLKVYLEFTKGEFKSGVAYPQRIYPVLVQEPFKKIVIDWEGKSEDDTFIKVEGVNAEPVILTVTSEEGALGEPVVDGAWITVTRKSVTESVYQYELTFADNQKDGKSRDGEITFAVDGLDFIKQRVSVTQKAVMPDVKLEGIYSDSYTLKWDESMVFNMAVEPTDATVTATITAGSENFSCQMEPRAGNYPGEYVLTVSGKKNNETGAVITGGKLTIVLTNSDGKTLTKVVAFSQDFKPAASGITIDLEGDEHSITGRPLTFYASGSENGYKLVNANNPSQNMGYLTVHINNDSGQIAIMPWSNGPGSVRVAVVPADFAGDDCSGYPQFTIKNS